MGCWQTSLSMQLNNPLLKRKVLTVYGLHFLGYLNAQQPHGFLDGLPHQVG